MGQWSSTKKGELPLGEARPSWLMLEVGCSGMRRAVRRPRVSVGPARGSCCLDQLALAVVDHVLDDLGRPVGELAVLRDELVASKLLVADFRLGIARDL